MFLIKDILDSFAAGKSKGLIHFKKDTNGISYIGATNKNNGVLSFVKADATQSQKGNCIEFIKNGNGSAGYAIYKRENFCSSMDFIFGYADWLNKENGLFFSTCSDMSKEKYHHGHKWTKEGLKKSRIMLRFFSNFIFYISNHITAN